MTAPTIASLCVFALLAACGGRTALLASPLDDPASDPRDGAVLDGSSRRDGPTADASPILRSPVDGRCPDGYSPCGRGDGLRCYDLSRSNDNCGACGFACSPGIACRNGACAQYRCKGALSFKALPSQDGDVRAIGDFDNDGLPDLVGTTGPFDSYALGTCSMALFFGAGDGTFATRAVIDAAAIRAWQASAADLDGDGLLDLVSISTDGASVAVRRGSGNRTAPFGQATNYPANKSALGEVTTPPFSFTFINGLLLADLDTDGRIDLVTVGAKGLAYWRGQEGGRFGAQTTLDTPTSEVMGTGGLGIPLAATDWNADGILDLVYTSAGDTPLGRPAFGRGRLHYRLGHGDGTFGADTVCALSAGIVADMNNDHRPDLLNGPHVWFAMDSCHAYLRGLKYYPLPQQGAVAPADLNGDGNLDVTVAPSTNKIAVHVGDGIGLFFQSLSMSAPPEVSLFLTGDLNRDGKMDFVASSFGRRTVFLNTCQ